MSACEFDGQGGRGNIPVCCIVSWLVLLSFRRLFVLLVEDEAELRNFEVKPVLRFGENRSRAARKWALVTVSVNIVWNSVDSRCEALNAGFYDESSSSAFAYGPVHIVGIENVKPGLLIAERVLYCCVQLTFLRRPCR